MQPLDTAVAKSTYHHHGLDMSQQPQLATMAENSAALPLQDHVCSSSDNKLQCSEYFGMWLQRIQRNGAEWVQCSYCQWIHEDQSLK